MMPERTRSHPIVPNLENPAARSFPNEVPTPSPVHQLFLSTLLMGPVPPLAQQAPIPGDEDHDIGPLNLRGWSHQSLNRVVIFALVDFQSASTAPSLGYERVRQPRCGALSEKQCPNVRHSNLFVRRPNTSDHSSGFFRSCGVETARTQRSR